MKRTSAPCSAAIIGLGALGVMFGQKLQTKYDDSFHIIVDSKRRKTYEKNGITCNGTACNFRYITPEDAEEAVDLIIFGTKYNGLSAAIETARPFVGERTVVMSMLNGISSELDLAAAYGRDKVLYTVAHGMDATRVGGNVEYKNAGVLEFGEADGTDTARVRAVADFLSAAGVTAKPTNAVRTLMFGKLMLNVGVNQTVTAVEGTYGDIQRPGEARDTMLAAMREVLAISQKNGVNLTEDDVEKWLQVVGTLNPQSYPSMRQDALAKRETEVELFAGTVIRLGKEYGVPTPVNEKLYAIITDLPIEREA